ncbi:MAG: polymer-forming cytoskeletal protein [Acidobacteria bacterium]|nr:polymer-forming cytoskeletal protein [Acidobacteriota bacterium]
MHENGAVSERPTITTIGKSIVINGELRGDEELVIEGQFEGDIKLNQHALTIGRHGKVRANIVAKSVVVAGEMWGDITAAEKVEIRSTGSVDSDIRAPRVAAALGARFRGSIDMRQSRPEPPVATLRVASGTARAG